MKTSRLMEAQSTRGFALGLCCLSMLMINSIAGAQPLFSDNFDSLGSPIIATNTGATYWYNLKFSAVAGPVDFKVIFGFDYSTVNYPTNIPSAPHSSGTSKGLYL